MNVIHESASRRFVVRLSGGRGELLYTPVSPTLLDLHHAEVSPSLRGQGLAVGLVAAACDYARVNGLKLIPSCPYVAWWFQQHPEQRDLLG